MVPRRALRASVVVLAAAAVIAVPVPAEASRPAQPDAIAGRSDSALTGHPGVSSRGDRGADRGDRRGSGGRGQAETEAPEEQAADDCPTEMWTVPLELKGVLCLLVLEKHPEEGGAGS